MVILESSGGINKGYHIIHIDISEPLQTVPLLKLNERF
jgi:hypothetical protein